MNPNPAAPDALPPLGNNDSWGSPDVVSKTDHHPAAHVPGGCDVTGHPVPSLGARHTRNMADLGLALGRGQPTGPVLARIAGRTPPEHMTQDVADRLLAEGEPISWDELCRSLVADARRGFQRDTAEETFTLDVLFEARANPERRRQPERPTLVEVQDLRLGEQLEYEMLRALARVLRSNTVELGKDGKLTAISVRMLLTVATKLVFGSIAGDDTGSIAERIELSRFGSDGRPVPAGVRELRGEVVGAAAAKVGAAASGPCGCGICNPESELPLVAGGQGRPDYTPASSSAS